LSHKAARIPRVFSQNPEAFFWAKTASRAREDFFAVPLFFSGARYRKGGRMTILFHKPYGVLSQFTPEGKWRSLAEFSFPPRVYPAGRLDADSEGLLVLTDDGALAHTLTDPRFAHPRTYWVQVEGAPSEKDFGQLTSGIPIQNYRTRPAEVSVLSPQPEVAERIPPIRFRANIPATWIALTLSEGKNRQVRRMTAACGFPTLRLLRVRVGDWSLSGILPGEWVEAPDSTFGKTPCGQDKKTGRQPKNGGKKRR